MLRIIFAKINELKPRWLLTIAIIFFILLLSASAGLIIFDGLFKNRVYPNIFIGNLNLGGQSAAEAKRLLNQEVDRINQRGIIFSYKDFATQITPVIASADGDLAYQIINFSIDQAVAAAVNYGRGDNFFSNLENKLLALTIKKQLALTISINREELIKILKNNFAKTIDYEEAIDQLTANLANLNPTEIKLTTVTQYPKILTKDCLNIASQARELLALAPLTLKYGAERWIIDQDLLTQFLALKPNDLANAPPAKKIKVGLDNDKFKAYLTEQISSRIDKKPLEARLEINEGKVTKFQNSQDGLALNLESSLIKIANEMTATSSIELVVEIQPALTKTGDING